MNVKLGLYYVGIFILGLTACANPYRINFNSTKDRFPSWVENRLLPHPEKPQLRLTENIQSDGWGLFERGYFMVGYSKFDGPKIEVDLAIAQGAAAGAHVVLVQRKYAKTLTETVTVTHWPPSETTEIREKTDVSGGTRDRQVDRRVEITTSRGPETVYVPKQVDYYEHSATFWRKIDRPVFGGLVQDLTEDLRQKLQANRGLVVRAVMLDSPAFKADLLKGDIILKINDEPVPSAAQFYENLKIMAGKNISVSLLRGSNTINRIISLNP